MLESRYRVKDLVNYLNVQQRTMWIVVAVDAEFHTNLPAKAC
jgi:hypothetical protein